MKFLVSFVLIMCLAQVRCEISVKRESMFLYFSAFKFGEFTLKSGEKSPVYFDLRVIISYPDVIDQLNDLLYTFIQEKGIECDQLCGVPYTGKIISNILLLLVSCSSIHNSCLYFQHFPSPRFCLTKRESQCWFDARKLKLVTAQQS